MPSDAHDKFIRPEEFLRAVGLRAEQTLAHFGAGAGFFLIPAAKIVGPEGKAIGIDVLPDMLAEIQNKAERENALKQIETIRANLENKHGSTLQDNSVDWVLIANVLHQSDPKRLLEEASRVVSAMGHIIVLEWDVVASPLGPPSHERISQDEVIEVASQTGLKVEKKLRPSQYHFAIVLTKQER